MIANQFQDRPEDGRDIRKDVHQFICPACTTPLTQQMEGLCDLVDRYRTANLAETFRRRLAFPPITEKEVVDVQGSCIRWLSELKQKNDEKQIRDGQNDVRHVPGSSNLDVPMPEVLGEEKGGAPDPGDGGEVQGIL